VLEVPNKLSATAAKRKQELLVQRLARRDNDRVHEGFLSSRGLPCCNLLYETAKRSVPIPLGHAEQAVPPPRYKFARWLGARWPSLRVFASSTGPPPLEDQSGMGAGCPLLLQITRLGVKVARRPASPPPIGSLSMRAGQNHRASAETSAHSHRHSSLRLYERLGGIYRHRHPVLSMDLSTGS